MKPKDELITTQRNDESWIKLAMDVRGFLPDELSLKVAEGELTVRGVHKCDGRTEDCFEKSFFWRRTLPEGVDPDSIKANLASNGELIIEAKKEPKSVEEIKIDKVSGRGGRNPTPEMERRAPEEPKSALPNLQPDSEDDATVEVVVEPE